MNIFTPDNLAIIAITLLLWALVNYIFIKIIERHNNLSIVFISNVIKVTVILFGLYAFLSQYSIFDKILTALLTNSALIVAVIGFALQNTIKNLLAGMMLLSSDAFKVGDRIRLPEKNLIGDIEELTLRHTTIKLYTNERAIIPNSIMNEAIVINNDIKEKITSYPISFIIPIDKNICLAKQIMEETIQSNHFVLNKEMTKVTLSHTTKDSVELKALIWSEDINTSFKVISELKLSIITKLQKENIY